MSTDYAFVKPITERRLLRALPGWIRPDYSNADTWVTAAGAHRAKYRLVMSGEHLWVHVVDGTVDSLMRANRNKVIPMLRAIVRATGVHIRDQYGTRDDDADFSD